MDPLRVGFLVGLGLLAGTLAACAGDRAGGEAAASASIAAAVAHPDRPDEHRADDAQRKPQRILEFFEVEPGMRVLDVLAGGGYYTELLARVVGPRGQVVFHNNQPFVDFMGEGIAARTAGGRLPNVKPLQVELPDLDLPDGGYDAVFMILVYHDLFWDPADGSWPSVDLRAFLAEVHTALKPGGILAIVDHSAPPGSDLTRTASTLHRIDEAAVKRQITGAGFLLEGETDLLRNADDTLAVGVFDPSMRRRTDRFVLRFRKRDT